MVQKFGSPAPCELDLYQRLCDGQPILRGKLLSVGCSESATLIRVFRVPSLALKVRAKKWNPGFLFKVGD